MVRKIENIPSHNFLNFKLLNISCQLHKTSSFLLSILVLIGGNAETVAGLFSVISMNVYAAARLMNAGKHLSVS